METAPAITKTADNIKNEFFAELAKIDPEDHDLSESVKKLELAASGEPTAQVDPAGIDPTGVFVIGSVMGSLIWSLGLLKAKGSVSGKSGAGTFKGAGVPSGFGPRGPFGFGGPFKLWITTTSVRLELYHLTDPIGGPAFVYTGVGLQTGLTNPKDQPWTGDWY